MTDQNTNQLENKFVKLLNVGDSIYHRVNQKGHSTYPEYARLGIRRVTGTMAFADFGNDEIAFARNYLFGKQDRHRVVGKYKKIGMVFYCETEIIKSQYYRTTLVKKITGIDLYQLSTEQLQKIIEISAGEGSNNG